MMNREIFKEYFNEASISTLEKEYAVHSWLAEKYPHDQAAQIDYLNCKDALFAKYNKD